MVAGAGRAEINEPVSHAGSGPELRRSPRFIPQPAVLGMLTEESRKHPSFQLRLGTAVRDLIRAGDRVVGVRADSPDGSCEFPADLVIASPRPSARYSCRSAHRRFA
jgi:2-polyprenyl-6-methoxyphenol hydroxylase-like FAD-dependent oxidoreductase